MDVKLVFHFRSFLRGNTFLSCALEILDPYVNPVFSCSVGGFYFFVSHKCVKSCSLQVGEHHNSMIRVGL